MPLPIIPLAAAILLLSLALYRYIIYPIFFSPLSKVPSAHWSSPISSLWILNLRRLEQQTPIIHDLHKRLGPIIRLGPNDLSVNCVDGGLRSIYAGGFEKGDWYSNVFNNYDVEPMFAMSRHAEHSRRKRMMSNIYAKSTLQNSEAMKKISKTLLSERLIPRLKELSANGSRPVEFYDVFSALTMDFTSAYVLGLKSSSNLMLRPDLHRKFFRDYKARQRYQFWPQEAPQLTFFLKAIGLKWLVVPTWVDKANADIEAWILSMCDAAEETLAQIERTGDQARPEDYPTVYAQLRNALLKDEEQQSGHSKTQRAQKHRLAIASEMLDHTIAGFDTSSITLTFYAWEIGRSQNRQWQEALRSELHSSLTSEEDLHDAKKIDSLPILHATLMETLRLHAAIPGNQPRITPPHSTLGVRDEESIPFLPDLPAGIRVQSQAWTLHRDASVFPDPETWNPGRWLKDYYPSLETYERAQKAMARNFWAFGSGGRMCVGSNLAMVGMKGDIAAIWGPGGGVGGDGAGGITKSELVDEETAETAMVHRGGYVAEPVGWEGGFCLLKVEWDEKGEEKD
jgi:cytochrome P450